MESKIYLCGDIDDEKTELLINQILEINNRDKSSIITIYISSNGGYIENAFAIYDLLKVIDNPIKTVALGFVYSAALIIFLGGDNRCITENTNLMYHQISYDLTGTNKTIKRSIDHYDYINNTVHNIITKETDIGLRTLKSYDLLEEDLYLDPSDAVELGFCDLIIKNL